MKDGQRMVVVDKPRPDGRGHVSRPLKTSPREQQQQHKGVSHPTWFRSDCVHWPGNGLSSRLSPFLSLSLSVYLSLYSNDLRPFCAGQFFFYAPFFSPRSSLSHLPSARPIRPHEWQMFLESQES